MTDMPSTDHVRPYTTIDVDMGSDLSDPPAEPSPASSVLSSPPEGLMDLKKKISLNDKPKAFKIKSEPSSKRTANGTPKKKVVEGQDERISESPEASTSKALPEPTPLPRLIPANIEEDWQIPYIFAFADKFFDGDVKDSNARIKGLFTIDDLERGLLANSPEDVMVEIIMRFLNNLQKKTGKKADMDTLTANLSSYINFRLQPGTPLTVWDEYFYTPYVQRPIKKKSKSTSSTPVTNGKGKGKARDSGAHTEEAIDEDMEDPGVKAAREYQERLARNPLAEKGLWELSWHERSTMLRQMVDWQLIEHQDTRDYIDVLYPSKKKRAAEGTAITTEPINKDSENKRIWLFEPTYRIYTQTNPLHFASEWRLISSTKEQYMQHLDRFKASGETAPEKAKAKKAAKGKAKKAAATKAEAGALRDGEIAKVLEARLSELEAFEMELVQDRLKFAASQERSRRAREIREAKAVRAAQYLTIGPRRSGRINYAEVQEEEPEDEEEDFVEYAAPARRRGVPLPDHDTANGTANGSGTNGTLTPAEISLSDNESEDAYQADDADGTNAEEEEDSVDENDSVSDGVDDDEDLHRNKRITSFDDEPAPPKKKRRVESINSDENE